MRDDIRNLVDWYPVLPTSGTRPDFIGDILNMRVVVDLPTGNPANVSFSLALKSINTNTASVRCTCELFSTHYSDISVPVYIGTDAVPTTDSYIVMRNAHTVSDIEYMLNNDVAIIRQTCPVLLFWIRTPDSQDRASQISLQQFPYSFEDGNNVSVTFDNDTLTFAGGEGFGDGIWTNNPFTDSIIMDRKCGKGLRSISGIYELAQINSGPALSIETIPTVSENKLTELRLRIRPVDAASEDMA